MGRHAQLAALLAAGFGVACSTDSTVTKTQVRRGTTSAVATAGTTTGGSVSSTGSSASTGSATSGAGTTGSGTTSGASTASSTTSGGPPQNCLNTLDAGMLPLTDCAAGQVELLGQVVNYCAEAAPVSGGLTITDVFDPSVIIKADSCGIFHSCTTPGQQLKVHIDSAGLFAPTSLPIAEPFASSELVSPLALVCNQLYEGLIGQFAAATPYNPDGGGLFVVTLPDGNNRCADPSGWQFVATDRDGNPVPAAVGYITGAGFDPQATYTSSAGIAILYNIDPSLGIAQITGIDAYADGGATTCALYAPSAPLTASLPVEAGRFTDVLWNVGGG